jgi:hypothetical protein
MREKISPLPVGSELLVLITILGTRGNIESAARRYSRHSGILVDRLILLDAGEREYLKLHPRYVFITIFILITPS